MQTKIAKATITLSSVNDAYSVLLSPGTCVINADFDGTNPKLENAYTNISVTRGSQTIDYDLKAAKLSNQGISFEIIPISSSSKNIVLTDIPTDLLSGFIEFEITAGNNYFATATFSFTVVRESSMLDWIVDWNNNRTQIDGNSVITPKLFAGTKNDSTGKLTGVYLGPDQKYGPGIYGYKDGAEIFHVNESGGKIGGWDIYDYGIQTSDGSFQLLSNGSIFAKDENHDLLWGIYKSGKAEFAKGNVQFNNDGSAVFKGKITSSEGEIGSWKIKQDYIYSKYVILDASANYIGIGPYDLLTANDSDIMNHFSSVASLGGVCLHYRSDKSFGINGFLPNERVGDMIITRQTFNLGSDNFIAGWNFDCDSLYIEDKNNNSREFTESSRSITIGTNGIRSSAWRLEADGSGALAKGNITWDRNGMLNVNGTIIAKNFYKPFDNLIGIAGEADIYYIDVLKDGTAFLMPYSYRKPNSPLQKIYLPDAELFPGLEMTFYTPYCINRLWFNICEIYCQEKSFLYFNNIELPGSDGENIPYMKLFTFSTYGGMVELVSTGNQWLIKSAYGDVRYGFEE